MYAEGKILKKMQNIWTWQRETQHNNMHLPFLHRLLLFICLVYSVYALKEKEDLQYKVDIIDKPVKKEIRKQVTSQSELLATHNIPIVLSTLSLIPLYLIHTLSISHSHLSFSPHFKIHRQNMMPLIMR